MTSNRIPPQGGGANSQSYLPSRGKRWGSWSGAASIGASGIFDNNFIAVGTATSNVVFADGKFFRYTSGTNDGDNAGLRYQFTTSCRGWNPRFKVRFRLNTTSLARMWISLVNRTGSDPTGDDDLNATYGIGFGKRSADTVWQMFHNNNADATIYENVSGDPAVNDNIHTIELVADDANSRFLYSFDNGPYNTLSTSATEIPAQVTTLSPVVEIETNEQGVAKTLDLFYIEMEQDR